MTKEEWNKYKNLEYYPNRFCECGCGDRIKVKSYHSWHGIPKYLPGHHRRISREIRICRNPNCNITFEVRPSCVKKYCCNRCANQHNGKNLTKETRICPTCNDTFEVCITSSQKFCCRKCIRRSEESKKNVGNGHKGKFRVLRETRICPTCGRVFEVYPSSKRKYCSKVCIWRDPEFAKMMIEAQHRKPNNFEKQLNKFLQKILLGEYQINVKAEVMTLGGKCPDFVNVNGQKKIIEAFGDYWHGEKKTGISIEQHEQERIDCFAKEGYQTLIIWEHELKDIEKLKIKLISFNSEEKLCRVI